jgi:DNA mismatch repair protein MutS2
MRGFPVFRSDFADIGDEQSIAANLSTFSWHITNIAAWTVRSPCRRWYCSTSWAREPIPLEGGALGVAIIEHFRTRGATVDLDDALRSA